METLRVFISGTQDDLQLERQAVADAVRALGHEPVMAETYGGQPMPSVSTIREMIGCSDIYVGVYGASYGSYRMENGISVTEFEFTEFHSKYSDRILIYVKNCIPESEQAAFLSRVQDFKAGYFRRPKFAHPNQLADWVRQDLAQLIARVVHEKLRGTPNPALIKVYLEQVAANKPYSLWNDKTYIDRTVAAKDDDIFYPRFATRYDPRSPKRDTKPEPLEVALAREKKLVLLGEPGIGKTTSPLHLAWDAANRALNGSDSAIPVYIALKYFNAEPELETLLARRVNELLTKAGKQPLSFDLAESTRILKAWLAQSDSRFLLLFDGLNEVRPEFHTAIRGALSAPLNTQHNIVVSCRERDYDASLRDNGTAFVMQGLQKEEIRDYLKRVMGKKRSQWLDRQIGTRKLAKLMTNPLMLWLIFRFAKSSSTGQIPEKRGILFQRFTTEMPKIRASEGFLPQIPPDVVNAALAKLAYELQECGNLVGDSGVVRNWQIPTASKSLEDVLAQAKDWRFLKSDGRQGEPIEFIHQLFLEYFAATYLDSELQRSGNYENVLGERPFNTNWEESIVILAGICEHPADLIKSFALKSAKRRDKRAIMLAHRCWRASDDIFDGKARAEVVDALITALIKPDSDIDFEVLYALGGTRDPRLIPLIIGLMRSRDEFIRDVARNSLFLIGKPVIEPLIVALKSRYVWTRWGAMEVLRKLKARRAVVPLISMLKDPSRTVRLKVVHALGEIGDSRVTKTLSNLLHDTDSNVGSFAADALVDIGKPAMKPLLSALHSSNVEVRSRAAFALRELGYPLGQRAMKLAMQNDIHNIRKSLRELFVLQQKAESIRRRFLKKLPAESGIPEEGDGFLMSP